VEAAKNCIRLSDTVHTLINRRYAYMGKLKSETFNDYKIAEIAEDELIRITELEQKISSSAHENIVLIAYKHCSADANE
jgi:hypothetical protein